MDMPVQQNQTSDASLELKAILQNHGAATQTHVEGNNAQLDAILVETSPHSVILVNRNT